MNMDLGLTRQIIAGFQEAAALRNQIAYGLATANWETNHTMEPVKEAYWLSENWRKAHLRYYPAYGRGLVQITWAKNYQRMAAAIDEPELATDYDLALRSDIAVKCLVAGMTKGLYTGRKLSDYIDLQHSDFVNSRKIINGTDHAKDIAHIAREYDAELLKEGVGVEA
ncbi:MAG: carboxypeptidase [Rhizobiaceae bacterium]|nr:MAG: carboxypeptidase [Rhizobiaceae bacterium]